jgi:surface antigen
MTVGTTNANQRVRRAKYWLFGFSLLALTGLQANTAQAHTKHTHHIAAASHHVHSRVARSGHPAVRLAHEKTHGRHNTRTASHGRRHHYASAQYHHSYLQCVPYAREVSHIELSGDAFLWWAEASGRYARGSTPAQGAVLNFRPIRRMPLGHVAVVTSVIDNRTIMVTQANWIRGTITNDVTVQDVSANNDWSQVQVQLGDGDKSGSSYPTYGFIYNQPDNGTVIANSGANAGVATTVQGNEVAEAPRPVSVSVDAPDRNLQ